jgi:hypothetical protein
MNKGRNENWALKCVCYVRTYVCISMWTCVYMYVGSCNMTRRRMVRTCPYCFSICREKQCYVQSCLLGWTRQYNPEDSSEHHTRRRENLKSHKSSVVAPCCCGNFSDTSVRQVTHISGVTLALTSGTSTKVFKNIVNSGHVCRVLCDKLI